MTQTIHKLDRHTIDSIAAGEAIERPASVVKELLTMRSTPVHQLFESRLRMRHSSISCEDDGRGMSPGILMAVESHATSKLVTTMISMNSKRSI